MQDKYLKNPNVRQAIAHAINRDEIIKFVLKGLAIPATTMLPPSDPYYKDTKSNDYNITLAQEMLNKSGFPDPDGDGPLTRFELEYKTTTNLTNLTIAKAIAAQLTKIGIGVKVQPLDWGKFKSDVEKGNVQLWTLSWVGFKDPDIYRFAFATSSFVPDGGNRGRYSNKKLDALLEQGRKTVDLAARKKIYDQVQEIVATDLPYVFLWHQENFAITNSKIKNFVLYADGRYTSLRETVRK